MKEENTMKLDDYLSGFPELKNLITSLE